MRRLCALAFALLAAPLSAQEAMPWRSSYFPYPIANPSIGLMLLAHYHVARQADYEARVPFDGIFSAEAGWSTNNSRLLIARFRAPLLVQGWRFAADAGATRESAFGYFGQGPDGSEVGVHPGVSHADDLLRMRRTRYFVRGEVTRKIAGPFSVAVGAGLTHFRFSSAKDGSLFATDFLGEPLSGNDATGRLTLLLDTRDDESLTRNGLLFEAGAFAGTGTFEVPGLPAASGNGYNGAYLHLRGYLSPRGGTVIAARLAARDMGASPPLDARYTLSGWEREITVMGGAESHRSFVPGRYGGNGLLLGSLEIRHNLLDVGDFGAVTLLAFLDGGRVFGAENLRFTTTGWKVGGGGGVAIRVLRSPPLTLNFAGGPDGFRFTMGNGFAF